MSSEWANLLSRDDLLGGLPARRASTLLFAIESRTAALVARSRRAMATYLTERSSAERERAFLDALAQGRDLRIQPTIQDLERYASRWADLVPADPGIRAALARMLGAKYPLPERRTPALRRALGLGDAAVHEEFRRLHGEPIAAIYAPDIPWRERLRWARSGLAHRLESLPPFWTAFALTLTETVGAGVLALPIAMAGIGPLGGVAVILVLGLVNVLTIAAVAEAVARNGNMRYGHAFFGRLVRDYLGRPGLWILTPSLLILNVVILLVYYVGLSTTLADATGIPPEAWTALVFLVGLAMLRRESLDATVASALVIGATSIGLILLLALLALPAVTGANLRHAAIPFVGGEPWDASVLQLIFGVVLLAFFGHTSTGNCAAVVLRADPSGRAFIRGSAAAIAAAAALYCLWVLAVNGAVSAETLAAESGTALVPLAAEIGPSIHIVGSIFVILAMGMASIHYSLGLFNQAREWLPAPRLATDRLDGWRSVSARPGGRFVFGMLPVATVFVIVESLLLTDRESFVDPIGFLGAITASLFGGVFPVLMVVASRRKGDIALGSFWRIVGHPAVAAAVATLFLAGLLLHGLVLWDAPYQRVAALLAVAATLAMIVATRRRGAFRRRAVVEIRVEPASPEPATVNVVAVGNPVAAAVRWPDAGVASTSGFSWVELSLPDLPVAELRVWAHRIDPAGTSRGLPVLLDIEDTSGAHRIDLRPTDGQIVLPSAGDPTRVRVTVAGSGDVPATS